LYLLKQHLTKISLIIIITGLFASCNTIKRVADNEHLLTEASIYVDDKKNTNESITNLLYQKPNSPFLGFPLRLHIYNLAKEYPDSTYRAWLEKKQARKNRLKGIYSNKQVDKLGRSYVGFNNWIKKTGEAPVIIDTVKTRKSRNRLRSYFVSNGWLDAETTYKIERQDNQRASVSYYVDSKKPYILDSISEKISSPVIDSLYQKIKKKSLLQPIEQYKTSNFVQERDRIASELRNSGVYDFSQDYITYKLDTIQTNKKVNVDIIITDRIVKNGDSTSREPFKIYTIKDVNILTDYSYETRNKVITDSTTFEDYKLYSVNGIKYRPKALGAETLELSAIGSIGASNDPSDSKNQFFDINELGANLRLTIPRFFFPFNTEKIIPKYMSPSTRISLGATSQTNIGLDKQTISGIFNYRWYPNAAVTNRADLFNIQFVKNLNTGNYFEVYQNSFNTLNLERPTGADNFLADVLDGSPPANISSTDITTINSINERKERLTEDNLIFSSNFSFTKDRRENLFDNDFSIFRAKLELAGNSLTALSKLLGQNKNENDKFEVFGVAFSQYVKTELDYVKHWSLGGKNVLATRSYFGFAIPYGNSTSIPFARSFFGGGTNDNRAWTPYNLGPGVTSSRNEFNEANLKLAFNVEQRFNLFGNFNGALFIDAGNIWNALDDVEDEDATFNGISSLGDIAIGAGFGLRYDFSFFVLRFDIGLKAHDPSYKDANRWFNDFNFKNAAYNLGINYPF